VALLLAAWLAGVLLVWAALWPAVWVDPGGAVWRMYIQVAYEGAVPHGWGNYFLGQAVDDPGPLFYPVALAFRLTPWVLVGLLAAGVVLLRGRAVPGRAALLLLLAFVLLFTLMLSLAAKKFDRYLLPIFPVLNILAAVGLVGLWRGAQQWASAASSRLRQAARYVLPAALALLLLANTLWYHPYYLAYYNPLLGGGALAARLIPIGWGEGLAEAGRYISAQLNGCDRPVASWFQPALEPFTCAPVVHLREAARPGRVDYVVQYIDQRQRENVPEISAMLRPLSPVHTVRIHGIDYAHIYQLPLPLAHATAAEFAPGIRLHSYELDSAALRSSGVLTLTTQWQAQVPLQQDYMLFVHVLDEQGNRVGQIDAPPGGPPALTSAWNPGHYVTWYHPVPVPRDLPAGRYWVALGLYDAQDFARLPLQSPPPPPQAPDDGAHALLLGPLLLP
jgi:4-amino-4-deoxy-L-arabinose transferase-like glycosyltransferase